MAIKGSKFYLYHHVAITYVFSRTQSRAFWEKRFLFGPLIRLSVAFFLNKKRNSAFIYPSRCPFSSGRNLAYFLFPWLFVVFLPLLSTPRQMDFSREEALFSRRIRFKRLDFATVFAHFFGRNLPVTLPFFFPAFVWLIFRFVCYYLAYFFGYFWFFCLFLVPLISLSLLSTP